jgi:DNA ligase (NAD+)
MPASGQKTVAEVERPLLEIEGHSCNYFVLEWPTISDEYDRLMQRIRELEAKYHELVIPDSPTQLVGAKLARDFPQVRYSTPMLSDENAFNADDLLAFGRQGADRHA